MELKKRIVKTLIWTTTTTTTTNTTKSVRIVVLPSHSCGGTLQSLYLKLLYNSMQTSADDREWTAPIKSAV